MTESVSTTNTTALSKVFCAVVGSFFNMNLSRFPQTVRIETTNACNAHCVICPHRNMQRSVMTMDEELYRSIIDQCAEYNCHTIHLHNFGEPLLDKNLPQRIRYAKDKGLAEVAFFSNGSLLTAEMANKLIDAGLDEIKISFDGTTKEEFEQIRQPLQFDTVINNIKQLVEIRNERKAALKIRIACHSTSDRTATINALENIVDKFFFGKIHNWADGDIQQDPRTGTRKPCSRLWGTFTILSSGVVSLCCLDYEGKIPLGNVKEKTIYEIWHSDSYKKVRQFHKLARQQEISICSDCSKSFW